MQSYILFVEDDVDLAQSIPKYLISFGYEVTLLHSGKEKVEAILKNTLGFVLLDIMLPDKDGLKICR